MTSSHYSDEFIAYAKEEDAINHQHTSNWIPCYAFITALPIIFIACAFYSNRKRAAEKKRLASKPGKWWWPQRLFAGRSSSANHNGNTQQQRELEAIEMTDLEAARTTTTTMGTTTKATVAITGMARDDTAANPETKATTRAQTAPRWARPASVVASDTGAVVAGGEFEDIDLEAGHGEEQKVRVGRWLWRPRRSGRPHRHARHPAPSWRRLAALPGEYSAFQFRPAAGGEWPRCENLVLVQVADRGEE